MQRRRPIHLAPIPLVPIPPRRVCAALPTAAIVLFTLVFGVAPALAQAPLQFTNVNADVLARLTAEGISGGEQVDALSRPTGNLTVLGPLSATYPGSGTDLRATVELDGGRDLFRFEGNSACAGIVEVAWSDGAGAPLDVLDAQIVAARADERGAFLVQAVSTVTSSTSGEQLAVLGGSDYLVEVSFSLGADDRGRAASFTRHFQTHVPCDGVVSLAIAAGDSAAVTGASDVGPAPADVVIPARAEGRDLLDTVVGGAVSGAGNMAGSSGSGPAAKSQGVKAPALGSGGRPGEKVEGGDGATFFCTDDGFTGPDLGPQWNLALIGDADQGSATIVGDRLRLSGDGTTLYHADDNGAFVYQSVTGDFRAEVTLIDVPIDQGGDFRKAGIMVRESLDPLSPRVMAQLVVDHPIYNTTALQFDFRDENGDAFELASTPVDLSLPLSLAVDRRGNTITAYFSTDGGQSWIKPLGGKAQGAVSLPVSPTSLVGMMVASYDAGLEMAVDFDDFQLCRPNLEPAPTPPAPLGCQAGRPLDLIYLVDSSGSMTAPIPGSTSKLAAVASAIADTNTALAATFPGSRAALVTYRAAVFSDPVFNLSQGAQVAQALTTNLAAVTAAAAAIDPTQIHPDANTPAPIALDLTTDVLQSTVAAGALPVVLWLTDGAPNIDIQGQGPLEYRFSEILGLDIRDTGGDFLPFGQVAWLGNWNGGISTFDGEVFANTMYQTQRLKDTVTDALIYPIAVRGED
ncbi:MAG: VWA domain-containing protein, partial [Holophagales bacterium]|nr:VWA domain-containing protein [Holophagales bacterium]